MTTINDLVRAALRRQQADGIVGWGLGNPDNSLFERIQVSSVSGCTSETCHHNSHDPAAAEYKLIPRRGVLVCLGSTPDTAYYGLMNGDKVIAFVKVYWPNYYWASASIVESVPDWFLANLAAATEWPPTTRYQS